MNQRLGMLFCLVLLSMSANHVVAQQPSGQTQSSAVQNRRRDMRELVMMPVVYRVQGMDKIKVKSDLKYTGVNNPHLLMDVYTSLELAKGERRPAVLFIHGGAGAESTPKDWGIYTSWGRLVAASGMVGVTFTHRLGFPKPLLAEAASDVSAALDYIRTHADSLNIDKDRICLAAYSAGGPMLSIAMRDKPQYVRCIVAFYAFMDIQQSELHRTNETPDMVKTFSPITYLANDAGKIAPMFIARAGLDEIPTMNDSIDRFIREAISKNAAITVANHPQGVHGFDNQNNDERSREIIQSVLAFMKLHLGVTAESKTASRGAQEARMFQGLRTVIYHVDDLQKAKEWYSGILGIKPYFDEQFYVGFNVGGYELGLDPNMQGVSRGSNVVAYWGVKDAVTAYQRVQELGAKKHSEPQDVGGGITVATVTDPFGNVFGIIENPHFKVDGGD